VEVSQWARPSASLIEEIARNCRLLPQNLANWIDDFRPIRESPQWLGNSSRTTTSIFLRSARRSNPAEAPLIDAEFCSGTSSLAGPRLVLATIVAFFQHDQMCEGFWTLPFSKLKHWLRTAAQRARDGAMPSERARLTHRLARIRVYRHLLMIPHQLGVIVS
jgi:hypothetical protein